MSRLMIVEVPSYSCEFKGIREIGELVRCKECKYASDNKVYGCMLNHFNDNDYDYHRMYADDFCSYGVKKGADDEEVNVL